MSGVYPYFFIIARWIIALCSLGIIGAWIHYFIKTKSPRTPIAALVTADGISIDITATENKKLQSFFQRICSIIKFLLFALWLQFVFLHYIQL